MCRGYVVVGEDPVSYVRLLSHAHQRDVVDRIPPDKFGRLQLLDKVFLLSKLIGSHSFRSGSRP